MEDVFNDRLFDGEFKEVPSDVLLVYLVLRADVVGNRTATARLEKNSERLSSGLGVQSIAHKLGFSVVTVNRCIQSLVTRGWVRKNQEKIILGTIRNLKSEWYLGKPKQNGEKPRKIIDQLRDKVEESKKRKRERKRSQQPRLSKRTQKHIARTFVNDLVQESRGPSSVMEYFLERYKKVYGTPYPISPPKEKALRTMRALSKNILNYSDGSYKTAAEVIDFTFDNWKKIETHISWTGRLTLNFFSTAKLFKLMLFFKEKGIPEKAKKETNVAKRISKKEVEEGPDYGF